MAATDKGDGVWEGLDAFMALLSGGRPVVEGLTMGSHPCVRCWARAAVSVILTPAPRNSVRSSGVRCDKGRWR